MIPVRLVLRDFLSYADPEPIDFTTFDVACLSGDNGVGKSALLDAITWALFGAARGCEGGTNQDRLIRDGCTETMVDFTFDLAGSTYRIVRRRSRGPRGDSKGDVRFLVSDGDDWRNLADDSLKATDAKIASVLRMDYRTFTASAFFVQGRSEDFLARLTPNERKDVFARLLDLGAYERLEEAARSRAREAERSRQDVAARVGDLEAQTIDVAGLERELSANAQQISELDTKTDAARDAAEAARRVLADLDTQVALLERERGELEAAQTTLRDAEQRLAENTRHLTQIDDLLSRADEVRTARAEMESLREHDDLARSAQAEAAELRRRASEIAARIDAEQRSLAQRIRDGRERLATLGAERDSLVKAAEAIERVDRELADGSDIERALAETRAQLGEREIAAAKLAEQIRALDEKLSASDDALGVLRAGGGECPVCGAPLDEGHRAEAKRRIQAESRSAKAGRQAANAAMATERKEARRLAEELRRLESSERDRQRLVSTREGLAARLERIGPLDAELTSVAAAVREAENAFEGGGALADLERARDELEGRAAELYDQKAHEALRRRLKELEPFAALAGRIEEAASRRERVRQGIEASQDAVTRARESAERRRAVIDELAAAVEGRPAAAQALAAAEAALGRLLELASGLAASRARLQERLDGARRVEAELHSAREAEQALAAEHRRYRRLVEAFGRGGIPDRVIDNALPQLEDDANRILGRLSDHEMFVQFQLQRDTKSGRAKDTFEALVHHDGGVRDYAMFSGGEAFRVAFAVRLAMSKLLVHRAGARLETLVIDEGFGTQDPHGRERLVEAINLARQEFAKIIVITHLDDLKDQFGAQIVVAKGTNGSELQLSGV